MDPPGWRPLTNTVEAVRAVRRLTAGEELDFVPTTFSGGAACGWTDIRRFRCPWMSARSAGG